MLPPTSIWTGAVYRVGVAGHGTPVILAAAVAAAAAAAATPLYMKAFGGGAGDAIPAPSSGGLGVVAGLCPLPPPPPKQPSSGRPPRWRTNGVETIAARISTLVTSGLAWTRTRPVRHAELRSTERFVSEKMHARAWLIKSSLKKLACWLFLFSSEKAMSDTGSSGSVTDSWKRYRIEEGAVREFCQKKSVKLFILRHFRTFQSLCRNRGTFYVLVCKLWSSTAFCTEGIHFYIGTWTSLYIFISP